LAAAATELFAATELDAEQPSVQPQAQRPRAVVSRAS
jgi:hypothetical protein